MSSEGFLKNSNVAASLIGRVLYAASSQLAISFMHTNIQHTAYHLHHLSKTHLIVPINESTKNLYSSAGASSLAFHTLL